MWIMQCIKAIHICNMTSGQLLLAFTC